MAIDLSKPSQHSNISGCGVDTTDVDKIVKSVPWQTFINEYQHILEEAQLDLVKWDCDISMRQARLLIWEELKKWMEK